MNFWKPIVAFNVALTLASACISTAMAEDFAIGAKVDAQPWGTEWRNATVTGTVQGGFVVKLDNGDDYVVPMNRIRGFSGTAISDAPAGKTSTEGSTSAPSGSTTAGTTSGTSTTVKNSSGRGNTTSQNSGRSGSTSAPSSPATYVPPGQKGPISQGKGKPPDGTYACVLWTAGMMVNIGKLEIKGNQYRGLNKASGFHPYTIDGNGNMALSAGLNGMPDGFTMKSVGYVGTGSSGKDLIHIKYIGRNNAHEKMDAIREN
ncbi:hypothetical protein KF913_23350 [Candidatus Obscuribacterales bacterium]|nr:hypothetical protein [Candidatus Obscuribacterales bacterium]